LILLLPLSTFTVKAYSEGLSLSQNVKYHYVLSNISGLVGYWRLDEMTGTVASDSSPYYNHGTVYGASWVTGKYGNALSFDGANDYVDCGDDNSLNLMGDMTFTMWVNLSSLPSGANWICRGAHNADGYRIISWGGELDFYTFQSGVNQVTYTGGSAILANKLYFLAIVRSGATATIYLNLTDVTLVHGSHVNPDSSSRSLKIGTYDSADTQWFAGMVDEVRVYNRALTQTEITFLYEKGYSGTTYQGSSLSSAYYWDFPEKQNFQYGFGYNFTVYCMEKTLNCTYPKTQSFVNITYYPYTSKLSSGQYSISSYNSTHNLVELDDSTINMRGNNYRLNTEVVIPTIIGLDIINLILILITVICGFLAIVIPLIGFGGIVIGLINILGLDTSDQFIMIIWTVTLILCVSFTLYGLEINKK
jgi:hypothetical protein